MNKTEQIKNLLNGSFHDYTSPTNNTHIELSYPMGNPAFLGIELKGSKYYVKGYICQIYKTRTGNGINIIVNRIIDERTDCIIVFRLDSKRNAFVLEYESEEEFKDDLENNPDKFDSYQLESFKELLQNHVVVGSKALLERSRIPYKSPVSPQFINMREEEVRELLITKIVNNTPQNIIDETIRTLTEKKTRKKKSPTHNWDFEPEPGYPR